MYRNNCAMVSFLRDGGGTINKCAMYAPQLDTPAKDNCLSRACHSSVSGSEGGRQALAFLPLGKPAQGATAQYLDVPGSMDFG